MKLGSIVALSLTAVLTPRTPGFARAADSKLTFEAASVKPAGPFVPGEMGGMRGGPGTGDPGRITIARATLSDLLARAYDVWLDQISSTTARRTCIASTLRSLPIPPRSNSG